MALSKNRQRGEVHTSPQALPAETDLQVYEVFTKKTRGAPHIHAGALHAPDLDSAVQLAREHYGQDEACVHIWVVKRSDLGSTDYRSGPINKAIEHSYRYARDYQHIHKKWQQFRDLDGIREYEKEDLKEAF